MWPTLCVLALTLVFIGINAYEERKRSQDKWQLWIVHYHGPEEKPSNQFLFEGFQSPLRYNRELRKCPFRGYESRESIDTEQPAKTVFLNPWTEEFCWCEPTSFELRAGLSNRLEEMIRKGEASSALAESSLKIRRE